MEDDKDEKLVLDDSPDSWKGPPLRKEDLEYFKEIRGKLEEYVPRYGSPPMDDKDSIEDRIMLIENVLEETKGKEYRLAVNQQGSRVLELIILLSDDKQICTFIKSLDDIFVKLSCDRNASFVIQSLIRRLPKLLQSSSSSPSSKRPNTDDDNNKNTIITATEEPKELLLNMLKLYATEGWLKIMADPFANFLIRDLFMVLAGIELFHPENNHRRKHPIPSVYISYDKETMSQFKKIFKKVIAHINDEVEEEYTVLNDIIRTESVVLCIQDMIKAMKQHDKTAKMLPDIYNILLLLNKNSSTTKQHIQSLANDSIGSRLLECIIKHSSISVMLSIGKILEENLIETIKHYVGNFTFQAYMERLANIYKDYDDNKNDDNNMKLIEKCAIKYIKILIAELEYLIFSNRTGVVSKLTLLSRYSHIKQLKVYKGIKNALKKNKHQLTDSSASNIINMLLNLPNRNIKNNNYNNQNNNYNVMGVQIAADLLFFNDKSVISKMQKALSHIHIVNLSQDQSGSRIVDACFESESVSVTTKTAFLVQLKTQFSKMAVTPVGSFCLENIFNCVDMKGKNMIANELSNSYSKLLGSRFGKIIIEKLNIFQYRRNKIEWEKQLDRKDHKNKLKDDFFEPRKRRKLNN